MKTLKTLALSALLSGLLFTACDEQNNTNREKAINDLERFVDSVETAVSTEARHNWAEIEREYKRLESNAEDAFKDAKGEEKDGLDKLSDRYDAAKADAELQAEKMSAEADRHMTNVQNWFGRTADNIKASAKDAGEATTDGVKQSMNWLEKNYENLEDGTKEQYKKLKQRFENENKES